jgi:pimeloyl-ACP methyl ester carboxylesterase
MEPSIQYARTKGGVSIACAAVGSGPSMVIVPGWLSHLEIDWRCDKHNRSFLERLGSERQLVRYDKRGTGLSDRDLDDYSLEAQVGDLEALVEELDLRDIVLLGCCQGGPIAISYTTLHPDNVSSLILYGTYHSGKQWRETAPGRADAFALLIEEDWGNFGASTILDALIPGAPPQAKQFFTEYQRQAANPKDAASLLKAIHKYEVTHLLSQITTPTLVLHRRDEAVPFQQGREIASQIRGARFVPLEGDIHPIWIGDTRPIISAIKDFLGEGADVAVGEQPTEAPTQVADGVDVTVEAPTVSFASGRYTAKRLLGEGGQKKVYLVHDNALDRDCALALIRKETMDPDSLSRIQREAQAMARLTHTNIVTVHDIGDHEGAPYIVCEYVPGGDLYQELHQASGPLPLERVLAIAKDLCRALAYAHSQGIIHRDLKPGNIWLAKDRSAKLGDFGLALAIDRSRLTMPSTVMGTASYMAPEQALGQAVDARTDLYALGCLLYELLTGRPPFAGPDVLATISQHLHAAPVPPSQHNPEIPRSLEKPILKLLAKAKEARPSSAEEALAELQGCGPSVLTSA